MTKEKVLVTGGAGYIGSILVPKLLNKGYKVRVFDNLRYNSNHSIFPHLINPDFEFTKGDIRDKDAVKYAVEGADSIIHLAALVGLPACKKDSKLAYEVNVEGTKNVLENKADKLMIFASTISNYGSVEIPGQTCTEETPLNPKETYSQTKTEAENLVKSSKNFIIYRFATAFGLSPRLRLDLLINEFVYRAVKEKQLIVYEKKFKRPFVHITDIADGIVFGLEKKEKMINEVYNLGSSEANLTKEDVAMLIKKKFNEFIYHSTDESGGDDKRNFFVDYSKINALGFKTKVSVEQGIEELIKGIETVDIKNPYTNI